MEKPMIEERIKFRHLECFLAVYQHGSLQKAATALCISQPAVSKTIKELEDILKIRLFDRGRRGAQMTPQAEIFFTYAEAAGQALQQASNFMGPGRKPANPVIRIGATPAMTVSFLPQALMKFCERLTNIQVNVLTGTTSYLMDQLRDGQYDLVLCRHLDPEQMAGLSFEYLYADPLVVVVRPGHPLLKLPSPGDHHPRRFTSILPPKTSINHRAAGPLARALDIGPITDFIESLSISFGRTYTMNSDAVWFVPWGAVKLDVERGIMVKLSPPMKSGDESTALMARSTGLMMRANSVPTSQTQVLIAAIRECALDRRMDIF
jgi:LysR family pca operon transcriptional activator